MINLDMIGRVREGEIYVEATVLRAEIGKAASGRHLKADFSAPEYGSSDHAAFRAKGVPVLFFFSGLHDDYHKQTDTWDKVDAAASLQVLGIVADFESELGRKK